MRAPALIAALVCVLSFVALPCLAASQPLVAVLDFRSTDLELSVGELGLITEGARKVVVERLGASYGVITRENLEDLLRAHGKTLEKCQGACETETGRMLGAELVITGHVTRAFGEIHLTMKIHRTDPPTLLATELGKAASPNALPELTDRVCGTLLRRATSAVPRDSARARAPAPVAAAPPVQTRPRPKDTAPNTGKLPLAEAYRISPLTQGYPRPALGLIAFQGALRDWSIDEQRKTRWLQDQDEITRKLRRRKRNPNRPKLLESRAWLGFYLGLLEASERSSNCWANHVRSGEAPLPCTKNVAFAPPQVLEDIKEYTDLTGVSADRLPDDLLFIMAFITLSNPTTPASRQTVLRWLEERLVPSNQTNDDRHIDSLLLLGKYKLLQGELYTAASLLTRVVDRTKATQTSGAFARYLLAWTYMADTHLGEERLIEIPHSKGTAKKRWGGGDGVAANLFDDLAEQLIQWKRWFRIERTAPALLRVIQQEQQLDDDWRNWTGPAPAPPYRAR